MSKEMGFLFTAYSNSEHLMLSDCTARCVNIRSEHLAYCSPMFDLFYGVRPTIHSKAALLFFVFGGGG